MSIKNLIRYYNKDGVQLSMLRRCKYICVTPYRADFETFLQNADIKETLDSLATQQDLLIEYRNNRSEQHLRRPNAIIVYRGDYTFIHPHLANIFFPRVFPQLAVHVFRFLEQKTYLHPDNPRNFLYISQEDGKQSWIKTFSDDLFNVFYHLYKIENTGNSYQHPAYFGHLVNKYIYNQFPVFASEQVVRELKELRETDDTTSFLSKLHQYLDDDGRQVLLQVISQIIICIEIACREFDDVPRRIQWLDEFLNDKKTGQLRLLPTKNFTDKVGV